MLHRVWLLTGAKCVRQQPSENFDIQNSLSTPLLIPVNENECHPSYVDELNQQKAKWVGGHDVSGHVYLLMLSSFILFITLKPCIQNLLQSRNRDTNKEDRSNQNIRDVNENEKTAKVSKVNEINIINKAVILLTTTLLIIWLWMLLITCVYFHTPYEKLTGLCE